MNLMKFCFQINNKYFKISIYYNLKKLTLVNSLIFGKKLSKSHIELFN